jgi:hypothetical protein
MFLSSSTRLRGIRGSDDHSRRPDKRLVIRYVAASSSAAVPKFITLRSTYAEIMLCILGEGIAGCFATSTKPEDQATLPTQHSLCRQKSVLFSGRSWGTGYVPEACRVDASLHTY